MTSLKSTALVGYSKKNNWAFTQQIQDDGKINTKDICSDNWKGEWQGMTIFSVKGDNGKNNNYIFGCSSSDNEIFIQAFTNYGALSYETYRESTGNSYDVCCSYSIGGQTYIFMHDTSGRHYAIRSVTSKGELVEGFVDNGTWAHGYQSVFAVWAGGNLYLGGHSKSKNKFFLQKILESGKLSDKESYSKEWKNNYETLIAIEVGSKAFVFGQQKKNNNWFTQEITSDGSLASNEADNGSWGNYYATASSFSVNGVTYFIAQSEDDRKKWFTQTIGSDGKFSQSESGSGNFRYFYSFFGTFEYETQLPTENWMTDLYETTLKHRTLKEIIMPGSHDAAMSYLTRSTAFGTKDNTQTQGLDILGQLSAGARYFDLRPITQYQDKGLVSYQFGHFSDVAVVGYEGAMGQYFDLAMAQINDFAKNESRRHELIILKFSHYLSCCWPGFATDWEHLRMEQFINYLKSKIGDVMIRQPGSGRIGDMTYEQLMGLGASQWAKVLVVLDDLPSDLRDPAGGIFRYADYPFSGPQADLTVYDDYTNTLHVDEMIKDQHDKLIDPGNHRGDMFLLSWTLTQKVPPVDPSIEDLARTANSKLAPSLQSWVNKREINKDILPNVIYVDYLDALETAVSRSLLHQVYLGS